MVNKFKLLILYTICNPLTGTGVELTIKPLWQELDNNLKTVQAFGGKWILAAQLLLKKKSAEPLVIHELVLNWSGPCMNEITTSLYKVPFNKKFMPLEEYWLCDSMWNKKLQQLTLSLPEDFLLDSYTTLYFVMTVPGALEPILKQGYFVFDTSYLSPLAPSIDHKPYVLAFNP